MRILIACVLAGLLTACQTTPTEIRTLSAYKSAPSAGSLLNDFIGDDEQTLDAIEAPMVSFQLLYSQVKGLDQPLYEFIRDNPYHTFQIIQNWQQLKKAVGDHALRHNTIIPPELQAYANEVEYTYNALIDQASKQNKVATVAKYAEVILKIIAAKNGVVI